MDLDSLDPTAVEDAFSRLGAYSVTLSDAGDEGAAGVAYRRLKRHFGRIRA